MTMNMNIPGQIGAAGAAASFFKGQDLSNEESSEARDKKRALRQKLISKKTTQNAEKANKPDGKNFLA